MIRLDLKDKIFYSWTVLQFGNMDKLHQSLWLCKCLCGTEKLVLGTNLVNKISKSCGCLFRTNHGLSKTRFYMIYYDMLKRCYNKNHVHYKDYGGRGIKVCGRWLGKEGFIHFMVDMYESYLEHSKEFGEKNTSLDRFLDVNGNYDSSNCRWATDSQQARGKRTSVISEDYNKHVKLGNRFSIFLSSSVSKVKKDSPLFGERIGIPLSKFKVYIESLFVDGMSWINYGAGKDKWSFDHIIPKYKFDLSIEEQLYKCFFYTNLRPRWNTENTCEFR
jgi:hypothetical protein